MHNIDPVAGSRAVPACYILFIIICHLSHPFFQNLQFSVPIVASNKKINVITFSVLIQWVTIGRLTMSLYVTTTKTKRHLFGNSDLNIYFPLLKITLIQQAESVFCQNFVFIYSQKTQVKTGKILQLKYQLRYNITVTSHHRI